MAKIVRLPLKYLFRLLSDFIVITFLLAIYLSFHYIWGPITRRGFFCEDDTLRYPFHEDTITYPILSIIGLGIPLTAVIVGSLLEHFVINRRPSGNFLRYVIVVNDIVLPFLFGFAAERLLKEIAKYSLGRLRPYFFAVCQPRLKDGSTCDNPENHHVYIEDYECEGGSDHDVWTVRTSFPSGHTTLAFYGMVFTIYYLQRLSMTLRRYRPSVGLVVPMLQLLCLLLAWFVAISRILDYKHHWSDVLAGGVLGASVAFAVSYYVQRQLRGVGRFLEAIEMPERPPKPVPAPRVAQEGYVDEGNVAEGGTMSVVSTQVSDISRSDLIGAEGGGHVNIGATGDDDAITEVLVHRQ